MPKMPGAAAMPGLVTILIVATSVQRRNQSRKHLRCLFIKYGGAVGGDGDDDVRAYLIVLAASCRSS
jgi:hypothetical protein